MKLFKILVHLLLVIVACGTILQAMELEEREIVTIKLENRDYKISLENVLKHILSIKKIVTERGANIHGFHSYAQPQNTITFQNGETLCKINSDLWIYSLGDITQFHTGYVIYKQELIEKPKTFFPVTWNKARIKQHLSQAFAKEKFIIKLDKKISNDSYKRYILDIKTTDKTTVRIIVEGYPQIPATMSIVTAYPLMTETKKSLVNLKSFAEQQGEAKKALNIIIKPMPELIKALHSNQDEEVLRLLSLGADPTSKDEKGMTLLEVATQKGKWDLVNTLLTDYSVSFDLTQKKTPLHYAIQSKDYITVLGVINKQMLNQPDEKGQTPLMLAADILASDIVRLLLGFGASTECTSMGKTVLMQVATKAVEKGKELIQKAIVESLLEYGASTEAKDTTGTTALMHAIKANKDSLVELLLNYGADYETVNNEQKTPLLVAQNRGYISITKAIEKHISEKQAWIKQNKATELMYAAHKKNLAQVIALPIDYINKQTDYGYSALYFALENKDEKMIKVLIEKGANPCLLTPTGISLYSYAQILKLSPKTLTVLADEVERREAPIKQAEEKKLQAQKEKEEAIKQAFAQGDLSTVTNSILLSISEKGKNSLFITAIKKKKYLCIKQLLALDLSSEIKEVGCLLSFDDKEALKLLLPHTVHKLNIMKECLDRALEENNKDILELLIGYSDLIFNVVYKALVDKEYEWCIKLIKDPKVSLSRIHLEKLFLKAAQEGTQELLEVLFAHTPVLLTCSDDTGTTALMYAVKGNNKSNVEYLCNLGVDIYTADKQGGTALSYAQQNILIVLQEEEKKRTYHKKQREEQLSRQEQEKKLQVLGYSPYMIALHFDDQEALKTIPYTCTDTDKKGRTALMLAAQKGDRTAVVKLVLLSREALNMIDANGNTALSYALHGEYYSVVEFLLSQKAQVIFNNLTCRPILDVLQAKKVPQGIKDMLETQAINDLVTILKTNTDKEEFLEHYRKFLAFLNSERSYQFLSLLSCTDNNESFKKGLELVDCSSFDTDMWIKLMACTFDQDASALFSFLLTKHSLSFREAKELCKKALKTNALWAVKILLDNYESLLKLFDKEHSPPHTLFSDLCNTEKNIEIIKFILSKDKTSYLLSPKNKYYALLKAAIHGNIKIVEMLLNYGIPIDGMEDNSNVYTPLIVAAQAGRKELVQLLLSRGANSNCSVIGGYTALFYAIKSKKVDIVQLLLEYGANVHSKVVLPTNAGDQKINMLLQESVGVSSTMSEFAMADITPLMAAVEIGCTEIVQLLLDAGTDIFAQANNGITALMIAQHKEYKDIEKIIIEKLNTESIQKIAYLKEAIKIKDVKTVQEIIKKDKSILKTMYKGEMALHTAILAGAMEIVQLLVDEGAEIDARYSLLIDNKKEELTPLMLAVNGSKWDIAQLLLKQGADVNVQTSYGDTVLTIAIKKKDAALVKMLLHYGAAVNATFINKCDIKNCTPLMCAVKQENIVIVSLLLEHGADVNVKTDNNSTALIQAIIYRNEAITDLLLQQGADVNTTFEATFLDPLNRVKIANYTPLMVAVYNGYVNIVKLLLKAGADSTMQAKNGDTALTIAKQQGNKEIIELIEEANQAYDVMKAVESNNLNALKVFIEKDRNIPKNEIIEPRKLLHVAVIKDNIEMLQFLLGEGLDINAVWSPKRSSKEEYTPLMLAAQKNNMPITRLLLEKGADINFQTSSGHTALIIALLAKNDDIAQLLLHYGANINSAFEDKTHKNLMPLHIAVMKGNIKLSELLLDAGANINFLSSVFGECITEEFTPLMFAVLENDVAMAKFLLDKGANVNAKTGNGSTALIRAVASKRETMTQLLLEYGADVNITFTRSFLDGTKIENYTPLMLATEKNDIAIARLLLDKGANVNAKTEGGTTALMRAIASKGEAMIHLLLEYGAKYY